jgi:hypothetical protein
MTEENIKKNKKKKEINVYNLIKNNIIRRWSKKVYHEYNLKSIITKEMFSTFHYIYMYFIVFIIIFNTNIYHLFILLMIMTLDALAIICIHECPITYMEKKYVKETDAELGNRFMKKLNISHNCDHVYEQQLGSVIIVLYFIALKCISIMVLQSFNIKLTDYSGLYNV